MPDPVFTPSPLALRSEAFFRTLQGNIIERFEELEGGQGFVKKPWQKQAAPDTDGPMQGGGVMALMHGNVFEKVGVNFSCVQGRFSSKFAGEIPGAAASGGQFWASGVSVVAHMANPKCPSVHFNVRRIETARSWFGGGADLTPTIAFFDDTAHFHDTLQAVCEGYKAGSYEQFKKQCDEYFFIPHRGEARGAGGIFFDNVSGDDKADFAFVQTLGGAFLKAFCPLVEKRKDENFTPEDKEKQQLKRGRYAEFNLLYDRGTRFGLQTGGNAEAILMSLPPTAKWP